MEYIVSYDGCRNSRNRWSSRFTYMHDDRWTPPTKASQWCGIFMFSLICAWTNGAANNRGTGDFRCNRAHYDVTVMRKGILYCIYCYYSDKWIMRFQGRDPRVPTFPLAIENNDLWNTFNLCYLCFIYTSFKSIEISLHHYCDLHALTGCFCW